MIVVDSYGWQSPAAIRAQGAGGTMRYASHDSAKCISPAEAQQLRAAGLLVGLVFEDGATNALGGRAQGEADGTFAQQVADRIGYPSNAIVFAAVDFPASPAQMPAIEAYFQGFAAACHRPTGPYGSVSVINDIMAKGLGVSGWQTAAWSGGQVSRYASLYQDAFGNTFDGNTLERWTPLWGMAPIPAPVLPPAPKGPMLNAPIIKVLYRPQGDGYWQIALDGGVFEFGAPVYGSLGDVHLNAPPVDAAMAPDGTGFWIVCADGGIFNFGPGALPFGSGDPLPAEHLSRPISSCAVTSTGRGLILTGQDGGIFTFGDALYKGSIPGAKIGAAPLYRFLPAPA